MPKRCRYVEAGAGLGQGVVGDNGGLNPSFNPPLDVGQIAGQALDEILVLAVRSNRDATGRTRFVGAAGNRGRLRSEPPSVKRGALHPRRRLGRTASVASRNASTQLDWPNSTLLTGEVPDAVGRLKREQEGDLLIMGSGALIQSLVPHNLIDGFRLVIHPLLLGGGARLFPDGEAHQLELVDSTHTTKEVILATYRNAARHLEDQVTPN